MKKGQKLAVKFDGVGDYLSIPDKKNWKLGKKSFTISMWVTFPKNKVKRVKVFLHPYFGFYKTISKKGYVKRISIGWLKIRIEYHQPKFKFFSGK